jgi:hypothetical protein
MTEERLLLKRLHDIRRRIRALFALNGVGRLLLVVPPAVLVVVLLDYLLHFPAVMRGLFLVGLVGMAAVVITRHLWRPLRIHIGADDVALELEGQFPELDDRLATTVSFIESGQRPGESKALRDAVVGNTLSAIDRMDFRQALRPGPLVGIFLIGLLITTAVGGLGIAYGSEAGIGLERLFNPLTSRQWPQRTHLTVDNPNPVCPLGDDYSVRVELAPGSDVPKRVVLHYREDGADSWERHVMDDRQSTAGEPFFIAAFPRVRSSFDYYVTGGDDRAPDVDHYRVDVRPKPHVDAILMTITPPEYVTGAKPRFEPGLGGTQALQGSMIRMDVVLNKPIGVDDAGAPRAEVVLQSPGKKIPMGFVAAGYDLPVSASDEQKQLWEQKKAEKAYLRAEFELVEDTYFDFTLVCEDKFKNQPLESRNHLRAEPDKAPRVSFELPTQAILDVTRRSVVELEVFAEDDYGVTETAFGYLRGESKEPVVQGLTVYDISRGTEARHEAVFARRRWDLRDIEPPLKDGEELIYRAIAVDNFTWRGAKPHTSETLEYRLRVISLKDKKDDLARRLPAMAMRVQALVDQQERLQSETKDTRAAKDPQKLLGAKGREQTIQQEGTQRDLKRTAEDLMADFEKFLDEWRIHRVPQNQAFELGKNLREALDEVSKDSMPKTADELRKSRDAQANAQEQAQGLNRAVDKMQETLDRLRDSLNRLDRFNEAEKLSQEFGNILRQQEKLTKETKGHAAKTLGKNQGELSEDEVDRQQAIERRQGEVAADTKAAIKKVQEAAKGLQETDPAVAEALQQAHDEATNRSPEKKMDRASKQVAGNQSANARENQEAAEEDLKKIIEKLEDRRIAELKDRIKTLQEMKKEVGDLKKREEGHLGDNKAAQQNDANKKSQDQLAKEQDKTAKDTKSLAQNMQAANAGDATQSTQQAAQSMQQASSQMSQSQSQNSQAQKNQEKAIEKLDQAKEELEEEIEQAKEELAEEQLEKMKEKLARIKDEEIQVNKATVEIEGHRKASSRLSRSDRGKLVFNQDKQNELLNETSGIVTELEEAGVKVFRYALTIVVDRMAESGARLEKSQTDRITQTAQEKAIYILGQLVEALEEELDQRKKKKKKSQGQGQGQGQGKKPKLVPTLAELKMLRLMQRDVNQSTETLQKDVEKAEKMTPEADAEAKRLGRDQGKLKQLMESLTDPEAGDAGGEEI